MIYNLFDSVPQDYSWYENYLRFTDRDGYAFQEHLQDAYMELYVDIRGLDSEYVLSEVA